MTMPPQNPQQPYDPVGAMGGMFAPAYIHGNPEAEAAVAKWQAENFAMTNPGVDATRGPSTTITNPAITGFGLRSGGGGTTTIPGSVDPEALRALAQGGKYVDTRDKIAAQVLANNGGAAPGGGAGAAGGPSGAIGNRFIGPGGVSLMRQAPPAGGLPPGMQMAYSPLIGLMGEGDNQGFMQGSFAGGA